MQIVQTVFGVFHHFELAHQLHRRGHLRRIFSTWPWARLKREGLPHELVGTFPLLHATDHVLHRTRLYPEALSVQINRWNTLAFDRWTRDRLPAADALIAISGSGLATGKLLQARGGKFLCDRGSTHQRFQEDLLRDEFARWQIPHPAPTPWIAMREETIYETADAITVPSSVVRRSFLERGYAPGKVHVIPYGVRLDRFKRTAEPSDSSSLEILFAGQVALRKGIPYLLEAFAQLKHPHKRLTVAGAVQEHLRPLLARLPSENVRFLGSVPQAELVELMSRAHMLVLPSVEEGLALVQAQAMACGCPVVATQATGAEDLFTDGIEGFIVPDRDSSALLARMQQLTDDRPLRDRMGAGALARVETLGGWETYGDRWEALLYQLTGQ